MEIKQTDITRREFCKIINDNKYKIGVEIGLGFGSYSEFLLKNSKLEKLYSIDPFDDSIAEYYPGLESTIEKLSPFKERSTFIRKKSEDAVNEFDDESIDFIYIDGDHRYELVIQDLTLWYPKLKKGGFFSGHDYLSGSVISDGVVRVVNEFGENNNIDILYVTDYTRVPLRTSAMEDREGGMEEHANSWYWYKK
jgi:predicted O-methyltransferase YrrM